VRSARQNSTGDVDRGHGREFRCSEIQQEIFDDVGEASVRRVEARSAKRSHPNLDSRDSDLRQRSRSVNDWTRIVIALHCL